MCLCHVIFSAFFFGKHSCCLNSQDTCLYIIWCFCFTFPSWDEHLCVINLFCFTFSCCVNSDINVFVIQFFYFKCCCCLNSVHECYTHFVSYFHLLYIQVTKFFFFKYMLSYIFSYPCLIYSTTLQLVNTCFTKYYNLGTAIFI